MSAPRQCLTPSGACDAPRPTSNLHPHPPISREFQSGGEKTVGTILYQPAERAPPQRLLKTPRHSGNHKQQDTRDSSSATVMKQQKKDGLSSGLDTVVRHRTPQSQFRLESLFPSNQIGQSSPIVLRRYHRSPAKDKPRYTRRSGKVEELPVIHLNLACSQNEVNQRHPTNPQCDAFKHAQAESFQPAQPRIVSEVNSSQGRELSRDFEVEARGDEPFKEIQEATR